MWHRYLSDTSVGVSGTGEGVYLSHECGCVCMEQERMCLENVNGTGVALSLRGTGVDTPLSE